MLIDETLKPGVKDGVNYPFNNRVDIKTDRKSMQSRMSL